MVQPIGLNHLSYFKNFDLFIVSHNVYIQHGETMNNQTKQTPLDLTLLSASYLLNDEQTAQLLGISAKTLPIWRSTGRYALPYVKIGRNVRYRAGDLRDFIESRTRLHTGEK